MTPSRPLVLCYHAVSESWPDELAIPPAALLGQVRKLLRTGVRPGNADDALAARPVLHVTFDDAYQNIGSVLPVLAQLRVPVTIFVCSTFADDARPFVVPELIERIRGFDDEARTMGWDELRARASMGVEIGSHTVSHPHLTSLEDAELASELASSKERLEDELGRPCRFLAYPYGEHDARVRTAARSAGYDGAFALRASDGDPFAMPRVDIYRSDGQLRVWLKTSSAYRPLQTLGAVLRSKIRAGGA
jgi:peptidoglycan/xylan/chitin deacetylase (PgdA/CDA1 family)